MKPLTARECAARANVSLSLVYQVLKSGALKALRIGARGRGCWRVMPEDLEAWLGRCRVSELRPEEEGEFKFL